MTSKQRSPRDFLLLKDVEYFRWRRFSHFSLALSLSLGKFPCMSGTLERFHPCPLNVFRALPCNLALAYLR